MENTSRRRVSSVKKFDYPGRNSCQDPHKILAGSFHRILQKFQDPVQNPRQDPANIKLKQFSCIEKSAIATDNFVSKCQSCQSLGYEDPRQVFAESVLNEVSVYVWELTRGINNLKELAWAGKGFLNDLD